MDLSGRDRRNRLSPNHSTKPLKIFKQESNVIKSAFERNHSSYRMKDSLKGNKHRYWETSLDAVG